MGGARYSVRDEIRETAEAFYRAVSNKNLKAIDGLWAHEPYASVAGRSGHLRQGWAAVHSYWETRFRELGETRVSARLRGSVAHAVGDVGWVSGTEIRTITEGDQQRREELRMTAVLERRGTRWQIVSYHVSEGAQSIAMLASAS